VSVGDVEIVVRADGQADGKAVLGLGEVPLKCDFTPLLDALDAAGAVNDVEAVVSL
jgi:hypothetical protein